MGIKDVFNGSNMERTKAFPAEGLDGSYGMDLRDYFAAQIISTTMQNSSLKNHLDKAKEAYSIADAMMEARKK